MKDQLSSPESAHTNIPPEALRSDGGGFRPGKGRESTLPSLPDYLFDDWPEIAQRINSARKIALFLDFDGTLAPFRRQPAAVRLAASTRHVLERLARHPRMRIWIISGRRMSDVRARVGIDNIRYLGLHGLENGDYTLRLGPAWKPLEMAREMVMDHLGGMQGVWVEDKGASFTVHYRGVSNLIARRAHEGVRLILDRFHDDLRQLSGNRAWEILPTNQVDKGIAVIRELRRAGLSPLVIYVGDDGSDELAFAALPNAITVCVGPRHRTRAKFVLRNTADVRNFLRRLKKELTA